MYDYEEDFKSVLLQSLKFKPLICASLLTFNWWLVNQQTNEPTLQRPNILFGEYFIIWNSLQGISYNLEHKYYELHWSRMQYLCDYSHKCEARQCTAVQRKSTFCAQCNAHCTVNTQFKQSSARRRLSHPQQRNAAFYDFLCWRWISSVCGGCSVNDQPSQPTRCKLGHWPSAVSDCSWMGKSRLCPAEESGGVGATNLVVRRNWLGALHDSSWIGKRRRRLSRWRCHIAQLHSCSCTVATLHSCRVASLHSIVKLTSQCIALLYFTCRNFFALSCLLKPCYNKIS